MAKPPRPLEAESDKPAASVKATIGKVDRSEHGEPTHGDAPSHGGAPLIRVSRRIDPLAPEPFLRTAGGGPRGFWGCGDAWAAWAGVAAELCHDGREDGRFAHLRAAAEIRSVLESQSPGSPARGSSRPVRFYGGLSFADGTGSDAWWTAFPAARFVAPRVELERRDGETFLSVTAPAGPACGRAKQLGELEKRLDASETEMREARPEEADRVPPIVAVREPVTREMWSDGVDRILGRLRDAVARKVVLARPLDLELVEPPDPVTILEALRRRNPNSAPFLFEPAPGQALVGAAPEMLLTLEGRDLETMVVAGSAPRAGDQVEDDMLGRELLASEKNRLEHRIGVEELIERLSAITEDLRLDAIPRLHRLAGIQHLRTDLTATLAERAHVLDLVELLHPTAAVCGRPRAEALRILLEEEPEPRGWYAGPIGWFNTSGDGEFAPALRSAVVQGNRLRLYAGCGIVRGSRPGTEWEETRVKFRTVLHALGVQRAP